LAGGWLMPWWLHPYVLVVVGGGVLGALFLVGLIVRELRG
jgi:hypothetical protein